MLFQPLFVELHVFEIFPDARVMGAAVGAAYARAVFIDTAKPALLVAMDAMAVFSVANVVRPAQVPTNFSALDFFRREREIQLAAD